MPNVPHSAASSPRRRLGSILRASALALLVLVLTAFGAAALWASSDLRLTQSVNGLLQGAAPNQLTVANVHWRFPLGVTLTGLSFKQEHAAQNTLVVHTLTTKLRLRPLFLGRAVMGATTLDGVEAWIDAPVDDTTTDETAPKPPQSDDKTLAEQLWQVVPYLPTVQVEGITLRHVRIGFAAQGGVATLDDGAMHLAAKYDGAHTLVAQADLSVGTGLWHDTKRTIALSGMALSTGTLKVALAEAETAGIALAIDRGTLQGPGLAASWQAQGHLNGHDQFTMQATVRTAVAFDHPVLGQLLDAADLGLARNRGQLALTLNVTSKGTMAQSPPISQATVRVDVDGSQLRIGRMTLGPLTLWASADDNQTVAYRLSAEFDHATVASSGTLAFKDGTLGAHRLSLGVQQMPVAQLYAELAPLAREVPAWAKMWQTLAPKAAYLPKVVNSRVQMAGPRLWPIPLSQVGVEVQADGFKAPGLPPCALPVTLTMQAESTAHHVTVQQLDVTLGHNSATVHGQGTLPLDVEEPFDVSMTASAKNLPHLLEEMHAPFKAAGMGLHFHLFGPKSSPSGKGALTLADVYLIKPGKKGKPTSHPHLGNVVIPLNFTGGTLFTRSATMLGGLGTAGLSGFVRLLAADNKPLPSHELGYELRIRDVSLQDWVDAPAGTPSPRVNGHALVSGTLERPEVTAQLSVNAPQGRATLWATGDPASVTLERLAVMPAQGGLITARGELDVAAQAIELTLGGQLPSPDGAVNGTLQGALVGTWTDTLALNVAWRTPASHLTVQGSILPQGQTLDVRVRGDGALTELALWSPDVAAMHPTGHARADLRVHGPWQAPLGIGSLNATGLAWAGRPVADGRISAVLRTPAAGQYEMALRAGRALRADISVRAGAQGPILVTADLPYFAAAALYPPLGVQGGDVTGDAKVSLRISRQSFRPFGTLTIGHLIASAHGQQLALEAPTQVHLDGINFGIARTVLTGTPGRLAIEGNVGRVVRATLAGHLALGFLTPFVPAFTYARGEMAIDARASGSRAAPDISGELDVTRPVVFRPRGTPIEVRLQTGRITLDPERLTLIHVRGGVEGGAFGLDGTVQLANYLPTAYALKFEGRGLPIRHQDLLLESNINLACDGAGDAPRIRGEVDIVSGRYLRRLELKDFSFVMRDADTSAPVAQRLPWLKQVQLDVHATSHDGVDIQMDAGVFAVKASIETDLHIGGNALNPKLSGKIQAREGELTFPQGKLQLMQAAVDFEPARRTLKDPMGAEVALRAEGDVGPASALGAQSHQIIMSLDGPVHDLNLDLTSNTGLSRLQVLSMLSTGYENFADAAQTSDDVSKLDQAQVLANSLVSAPVSRFAQKQIEKAFNLKVDLSAEVSGGNVRVMAAKNISRRFRLEGAFSHGLSDEQSNISTKAQMAFTDRLRLEGKANMGLTGTSASATPDHNMQSNLELKYRLLGQ
jgi:hypothetical protein